MILSVFLCSFGIIALCFYAIPLVTVKPNIGNIFGIAYSLMLIVSSLLIKQQFAQIVLIIMAIIAVIFVITALIIAIKSAKDEDTADTIIVLGCRVKSDKPSLALENRCEAAATYMKKHPNTIAILSGGQGADEAISEAECMRRVMTDFGIDQERIIKEEKSTTTYENLKYSKEIIAQKKLNEKIGIVSSDYHICRAGMIAKRLGTHTVCGIPARSKWYCVPTFYTREVFAIWAHIFKIKKVYDKRKKDE